MKALLIPCDIALAIREVQITSNGSGDTLDALQALVGGCIETIPHPTRDDIAPYFNEDGKALGLPPNNRATALLRSSIRADDYVAGDCVFAGFDPITGRTINLPGDFQLVLPEPLELGEPNAVSRRDRSITFDWLLRDDGEDERTLATLAVSHHRAGVSMLSGAQHPNEFTATLRNETEKPVSFGGAMRSFILFDGLRIDHQQVGRFSAKGLEAFAERALLRLRELCEAGDPRVMRYFAPDEPAEVRSSATRDGALASEAPPADDAASSPSAL